MRRMSASGTLIHNVIQVANKTFARTRVRPEEGLFRLALPPEEFGHQLAHLRHLLSKVKASDLGLDRSRALTREGSPRSAPVTYIGIFENGDISVGIFIIRRGCKIPLHNHPGMHGVLRVVHGTVDVTSYTKVKPELVRIPDDFKERIGLLERGIIFPAKKQFFKAGSHAGSVLLRPDENNLHEIEAGPEGPAAFLDILAPPYNEHDDFPVDHRRDCNFYRELNQTSTFIQDKNDDSGNNIVSWLEKEEDAPEDYFCDSEAFLGGF